MFDFTIGDEPYKREWCDAELALRLRLARFVRGWLVTVPTVVFRQLKRTIKRNPRAWAVVRKLRAGGVAAPLGPPDQHVQAEPALGDEEQQRRLDDAGREITMATPIRRTDRRPQSIRPGSARTQLRRSLRSGAARPACSARAPPAPTAARATSAIARMNISG